MLKILFFVILFLSIFINLVAFIAEKVMKKRINNFAKKDYNTEEY